MEKSEYLEMVEAPLLTQEGDTVARLMWHSGGVMIETPDGNRRNVDEYRLFEAGVSIMRLHDLRGIVFGEWVSARKARFG